MRPIRSTIAFALVTALSACMPPEAVLIAGRPEHVVTAPLLGRTGAHLTVHDAASRVRVELATLPGQLYRISTPGDSGLAPAASRGTDGRVEVRLRRTGADGPDEVRVVLNRSVRWSVNTPAGGGEQQLDLTGGRVTAVTLGSSGLVELRLPQPHGTLPVTLGSSSGQVSMLTADAPARFALDGGAGMVITPWAIGNGITATQAPGWETARDRYAVRAHGSVGALTVRTAYTQGS